MSMKRMRGRIGFWLAAVLAAVCGLVSTGCRETGNSDLAQPSSASGAGFYEYSGR